MCTLILLRFSIIYYTLLVLLFPVINILSQLDLQYSLRLCVILLRSFIFIWCPVNNRLPYITNIEQWLEYCGANHKFLGSNTVYTSDCGMLKESRNVRFSSVRTRNHVCWCKRTDHWSRNHQSEPTCYNHVDKVGQMWYLRSPLFLFEHLQRCRKPQPNFSSNKSVLCSASIFKKR